MRFVIQLFLAMIICIAAFFSVANRTGTKVDFSPLPFTAELPLYIVILGAIGIGLIIGASLSSLSRFRLRLESRKHRKRAEAAEIIAKEKLGSKPTPHSTKFEQGNRIALNED
jgi:uncharacterized integral membrane protein